MATLVRRKGSSKGNESVSLSSRLDFPSRRAGDSIDDRAWGLIPGEKKRKKEKEKEKKGKGRENNIRQRSRRCRESVRL